MIQVGDVLRGRYRIDASIGRGGMGEVFAAVTIDPSIVYDEAQIPGRRVAVKVVSRSRVGEVLMARLQREAIAAVRVRSDYVPQVLDVDMTEEGEVFLVMELLRGQTLSERLRKRGGVLTWAEVLGLGEDVLRGLIDAHAAGVIHRDLKPSNIFLEARRGPAERERARILDFGVCKLDAPDEEKLTTTGESVGTVAYMAPEQVRGASRVDERADLYSFACVVFEALAGRLAHEGPGQMALLASKLERPALDLALHAKVAIPADLAPLIGRLLGRKPEERPSSGAEVLATWLALGPATAEPLTLPALPVEELPEVPQPTEAGLTSGTMTRLGKKPSTLGLGLGVGAVVVSGAVLALMASSRTPYPAESATPAQDDPAATTQWTTPVASRTAETVETPTLELPATAPSGPGADPALGDPDAGGAAQRSRGHLPPRPVHPSIPRRGGAAPATSANEPHITDKPRY